METYFATCQEAARKNVERVFEVLQQRFAIVRYPALTTMGRAGGDDVTTCQPASQLT
jgi:hypothetical protein